MPMPSSTSTAGDGGPHAPAAGTAAGQPRACFRFGQFAPARSPSAGRSTSDCSSPSVAAVVAVATRCRCSSIDSCRRPSALSSTWQVSLRSLSFARVPAVCRVATSMIVKVRSRVAADQMADRDGRDADPVTPPPSRRRRTLVIVRLQRQVVDYALRRRSLLAEVYSGRTGVSEVCDANPYLLRAAKFHGKPSSVMCPICRKEQLTLVSWVFGDHLGAVSGSARTAEELVLLASRYDEFSVHVVEVCRTCSWNHLVKSYVLGAVRAAQGARVPTRTARNGARTASE